MYNSAKNNRIFGLDLMRAMAIIMVLLGHSLLIFPNTNGALAQIFQLFGFLGVELFFVLSGFLIGSILYRDFITQPFSSLSVFRFLKRRWYRTLPNYFLILLVNIIIGICFQYDLSNLWKYFLFLQNFATPLLPFFPESWSLSVEEYAYLMTPFFLLLLSKFRIRAQRKTQFVLLLIALILCVTVARISYVPSYNYSIDDWNIGIKSVVIYRLDTILYGMLAFWISECYADFWKSFKLHLFGLGLGSSFVLFFLLPVLGLSFESNFFFWNVLYLPFLALTISLFLPLLSQWKKTSNTLFSETITWVSLTSYSIYLIHYSIVLQILINWFPVDDLTISSRLVFILLYILISLILSYFLYRFYEKPIMNLRDKN